MWFVTSIPVFEFLELVDTASATSYGQWFCCPRAVVPLLLQKRQTETNRDCKEEGESSRTLALSLYHQTFVEELQQHLLPSGLVDVVYMKTGGASKRTVVQNLQLGSEMTLGPSSLCSRTGFFASVLYLHRKFRDAVPWKVQRCFFLHHRATAYFPTYVYPRRLQYLRVLFRENRRQNL